MSQQDDLQKAIKRFIEAANTWADKWDAIQALCQLLQLMIPGFVCPFATTSEPTLSQMQEWVNNLPTLYPELFA